MARAASRLPESERALTVCRKPCKHRRGAGDRLSHLVLADAELELGGAVVAARPAGRLDSADSRHQPRRQQDRRHPLRRARERHRRPLVDVQDERRRTTRARPTGSTSSTSASTCSCSPTSSRAFWVIKRSAPPSPGLARRAERGHGRRLSRQEGPRARPQACAPGPIGCAAAGGEGGLRFRRSTPRSASRPPCSSLPRRSSPPPRRERPSRRRSSVPASTTARSSAGT
jgi:hypothetical protein